MTSTPVSVVIPAFNAGLYIAEAIESVRSQAGAACEIIVVDDGSTDDTGDVARKFADVRVITRENGGIGAARNTGMREARAPVLAFLDADDIWPEGRLTALLAALGEDCDAAFGQAVQFGDGRQETEPQPALLASTMVIRRASAERIGEFNEAVKVGEFIDWWARGEESGLKWKQIPEVVLRRRIHMSNTGIVHAGSRVDYTRVLRAALERRRSAP